MTGLLGFGAEIVDNNDPSLVQFRQTPGTLAKAVMPVIPADPTADEPVA